MTAKPPVILIVLDGCRPDGLMQAYTPHADSLWHSGAYSWAAESVAPSYSLPTHSTMFRSVSPAQHGIVENTFSPGASAFPSVLDVAHDAGLHTAAFYSWEELRDLAAPGSLDYSLYRIPRLGQDVDAAIMEAAARYVVEEQPDFTFIYLQQGDIVGHEAGWMSRAYLAAIEGMDRALGTFLDALGAAGQREQTTFILLSDHGGHGRTHYGDAPEDLIVPWIICGPRIKRDYPLEVPVRLADTAATIAHLFELTPPEAWEGHPVLDAFRE